VDDTLRLKEFALSEGADAVGVADLGPLSLGLPTVPEGLLGPYTRGVSLAVRLKDEVVEGIEDGPTVEYADHYREANGRLDALAASVARWIAQRGFAAQAVPASRILDEEGLMGTVSHKAVARMAGLGWQGKSLLIVSPEFGPRMRLATVLTDMPLAPDEPMEVRCGDCLECARACPASAIRGVLASGGRYRDRQEALHLERCARKTLEFAARPGIGARVCGVCVRVCPFGA